MILMIRTDKPEAYVGIWNEEKECEAKVWTAHRELSQQLLQVIEEVCEQAKMGLDEVTAIVVYEGPGSYTGLRIGVSVANALSYSLKVPVVGSSDEEWQINGIKLLNHVKYYNSVTPVYGQDAYTTKPKK